MTSESLLLAVPVGLIGAALGSFSATAAIRLGRKQQPWFGRSQCDGCTKALSWQHTVPIAGYLVARGRCAACEAAIDPLHLWGEILGLSLGVLTISLMPSLNGALLAALGFCLLALGLIDARTKTLPDGLNVAVAALCIGLAFMETRAIEGLIAAVVSVVLLMSVKWLLETRRQRIMLGMGDVKLIGALALFLSEWTAIAVAVAAILGLVAMVLRRQTTGELPFGPMIAASGFVFSAMLVGTGGMS